MLDDCLDLLRRLPPQNTESNLQQLLELAPDIADDLLGSVDQPLQIRLDRESKKEYLVCDYNKDGDSYRSPWSNTYDPPLADGTSPSPALRKLEVAANEAFDLYREMYYEGGVSSVYFWDLDDGGFAGVVLIKKVTPSPADGSWDSIHVFESSSRADRSRVSHYKLTSTVMLHITRTPKEANGDEGDVTLSGSLTRQVEQDAPLDNANNHITNIGKMVEDMEIKMRNLIQDVYFSKTKDIVNDLRSLDGAGMKSKRAAIQGELVGLLKGRGGERG
ncbi:F-actin capping protein beta subunit [Atractiella rhizophila]|nr:F-actin capping protein beta subunit [Atractiella rhizophila]KAH8920808.1 F-actin capping protein beta subunit [Atractiella rhizophila]